MFSLTLLAPLTPNTDRVCFLSRYWLHTLPILTVCVFCHVIGSTPQTPRTNLSDSTRRTHGRVLFDADTGVPLGYGKSRKYLRIVISRSSVSDDDTAR